MTDSANKETCRFCKKPFYPMPMGEKNDYALVACRACGSVMTQKPITTEEREQFFADIQPQITHVPNPVGEIATLTRTIRKLMPDGQGKKFLDVNCRNGYAVMAAKELGFVARGIDPHDFFINFAQSKYDAARFENKTVIAAAADGEKADFIFVREGFSEQIDPDAYAAALAKILNPGGVIYIEEPNGNHFNTPRYFAGWPAVFPPMNFNYFSAAALKFILKRNGIAVKKAPFSWNPVIKFIAGHN